MALIKVNIFLIQTKILFNLYDKCPSFQNIYIYIFKNIKR